MNSVEAGTRVLVRCPFCNSKIKLVFNVFRIDSERYYNNLKFLGHNKTCIFNDLVLNTTPLYTEKELNDIVYKWNTRKSEG